ncbi:MAG TPA: GNAT family N-acetyltransferase [Gammaproteobacteria bacterium]|nr:GNAT family N-acetyltransferase [Gammaproteobacteria bacterium]
MGRVLLERPSLKREEEFLESVRRSRPLHAAYVAAPGTAEEYRAYLRRQHKGSQESYLVVDEASGGLAGVVNINDIVRYSFQSASLGYYAFVPFAGRGLMRQALEAVVGLAFREHRLHRLEANIQPDNLRSISLVAGVGFRLEGLSPRFLKIGGRWRDHMRWAILAEEWRVRGVRERRPV